MAEGRVFWRMPGEEEPQTLVPATDSADVFHFAPFEDAPALTSKGRAQACDWPVAGPVLHAESALVIEAGEAAYRAMIEQALAAIESEGLQKVVVSRQSLEAHSHSLSPEEVFRAKSQQFPHAFVYLWSHPHSGTWVGATPELLVAPGDRPGEFQTMSLAGTRRLDVPTVWSEKERIEQEWVTAYIRDRVAESGTLLGEDGPSDLSYGNIAHLCTRLTFTSDLDMVALARRFHPTPAVAGVPLNQALKFIAMHEPAPREFYSGWLGPQVADRAEASGAFVNLRCTHWTAGGVVAFAGAGIVAGSDPGLEWMETEAKLDSIRTSLAPTGKL
jgi:isochorismate synthase